MDRLTPLSLQETSQAIFWINLLPAVAGVICIGYDFKINFDFQTFAATLFILLGLVAEVIYFLQSTSKRFANNHQLWLYSIVYNIICIIIWTVGSIISADYWLLSVIFYPVGIGYLSLSGYLKCYPKAS